MFIGIYRVSAGKSECGDFKFMGIACIPAIPVFFEVNQKKVWTFYIYTLLRFFKFPYYFCGDFRQHVIPVIITCSLQGTFCDTGFPRTFYGGKICNADHNLIRLYQLSLLCATYYVLATLLKSWLILLLLLHVEISNQLTKNSKMTHLITSKKKL